MKSPSDYLAMAEGKDLNQITVEGLGGYIYAAFAAMMAATIAFFQIPIKGFEGVADAIGSIIQGFLVSPTEGIATAAALSAQQVSIFGFLALPAYVVVVLMSFGIVALYLSWKSSGNLIPGIPWDFPSPGFQDPEEDDPDS